MDCRKVPGKVKRFVSSNKLLVGLLIGATIGFIIGIILKTFPKNDTIISLVSYPGELFVRVLQLFIIPVIVFSLIAGSASLNIKTNGKIALRMFSYFFVTSTACVAFGITFALLLHPGDPSIKANMKNAKLAVLEERKNTLLDNFLDLGRNIIPNNVFSSFFETTATIYTPTNTSNGLEYVKSIDSRKGLNAIGLIFYSLLFGTVMSLLEEKQRKPLLDMIRAVDLVNMKTVSGLIWLTPIGVASLICSKVLEVDDMGKMMASLSIFILTVVIGEGTYQLVILQIYYFVLVRKNPIKFYTGVLPAVVTGFATGSSSATMPVTLKCLNELKIDSRVSHFVVPIGVICNMDGLAMYIGIVTLFIAQINNMVLGIGDYISICVTATAVSIAAVPVGIPLSSLTLSTLVLNTVGAPVQDIGLLFAIDWLLDRVRTTNNIIGDCYASAVVEHWSKDELQDQSTQGQELTEITGAVTPRTLQK